MKNYNEFIDKINEQLQYINIDNIKTEKEIVLIDTKKVNDIISVYSIGKMPLDKL